MGAPRLAELAWLYLSLGGRISRRQFWLWGFLPFALLPVPVVPILELWLAPDTAALVYLLLVAWPSTAISVKRLHDIDHSGWCLLFSLVPYIGGLMILVANGFVRGTDGFNTFGAKPDGG